MTIGVAIRRGSARLAAAGIPDAPREAAGLWAGVAGRDAIAAYADASLPVDVDTATRLDEAYARRAAGEPLAYVSGHVGFRHLALLSDARALIPRPETEGLVELILARASGGGTAADIGTGTGCIALSLATEGRFSRIVAVESSAGALALAGANAVRTGAPLLPMRADLTEALAGSSVDALVSNPPYLSAAEYAGLDRSVKDWEPALALVSGTDGLDATFRLLDDGRRVVRAGGWIALELDCTRATDVARRASALGWRDISVEADLFGRERYLLARRSKES